MSWNLAPAPVIRHRGIGLAKWPRALTPVSSSHTEAALPEPLIIAIAEPFLLLCFVPFEVGQLKHSIQSED